MTSKSQREAPRMIIREILNESWKAVYDAVLAHFEDFLAGEVCIGPVRASSGQVLPYYLEFRDAHGSVRVLADMAGRLIDGRAGRQALEPYLREQGFPQRQLDSYFLIELVGYFQVLPSRWRAQPPDEGQTTVTIAYESAGALLVLERRMGGSAFDGGSASGGWTAPLPRKLEVHFDQNARFTLIEWVDQGGGWVRAG